MVYVIWRTTGHEVSYGYRGYGGSVHGRKKDNRMIPVAMRSGETPVLIPNTMVKTWAADDTILETVWESRWLPD